MRKHFPELFLVDGHFGCDARGLADDHVGREALEAWSEHTTGPFQVRMFPGDHFYINTQRPLLLRTLAREVDTVVRRLS